MTYVKKTILKRVISVNIMIPSQQIWTKHNTRMEGSYFVRLIACRCTISSIWPKNNQFDYSTLISDHKCLPKTLLAQVLQTSLSVSGKTKRWHSDPAVKANQRAQNVDDEGWLHILHCNSSKTLEIFSADPKSGSESFY